ncbi:MAG: DUF2703 domain-containing protein [Treponema sp.]|nr:DUF2703 domain-containing protein [Treponema sp.]
MSKNWYPVIDRKICIECGACVEKCSHGVYDKKSPMKPVIINTDGCIEGCHGCGNLCPTGSITYVGENTAWKPPKPKQEKTTVNADCGCGCGPGDSCCDDSVAAGPAAKDLTIDFLYLDLQTCERCISTDETLQEAIHVLSGTFDSLGYKVTLNSVNITSKELAEQYRFESSPTIRVNGVDICTELTESGCADCGTIAGDSINCRSFVWEGKEYNQPPAAMIVDGILRVLYGNARKSKTSYTLPENLKKFFAGRKPAKSETCNCGCCGGSI